MVLWDLAVMGQVAEHFGLRASQKPHQEKEKAFVGQEDEASKEEENGKKLSDFLFLCQILIECIEFIEFDLYLLELKNTLDQNRYYSLFNFI